MKQVISIYPDGTMAGLQHKPGKGIDLRQFGYAKIDRASEIVWHEEEQVWVIHLLTGPNKGTYVDSAMMKELGISLRSGMSFHKKIDGTGLGLATFHDYDHAVSIEVEVLNAQRMKGLL